VGWAGEGCQIELLLVLLLLLICRLSSFLPEATAEKLAKLYEQPHFLEHYRAARKTCGER
jgi:hypothetical protein